MKQMRVISSVLVGLIAAGAVFAAEREVLFANYFDIETGSGSGAEVTGRIHLLSNKDAHSQPIPVGYSFAITSDPSGIFEIGEQRDSMSRLFGVLKVAEGKSIATSPTTYPLDVALLDGATTVVSTSLTVHAVAETGMDRVLKELQELPVDINRLYGRRRYSDAEVARLLDELEQNDGRFGGFDFYTKPVLDYDGNPGVLEYEWEEVATRIGGVGKAYHHSSVYGPHGDPAQRTRLKQGLYAALEQLLDRIPVAGEDVRVGGRPISTAYGDGFMRLAKEVNAVKYNFTSHQWRLTDPLTGPALWLMEDLRSEMAAGDERATLLHEKLVDIFQLCFANPPGYQEMDNFDARWGDLTDTQHTEGAFSDANLGHRMRGWISLLGIWGDYNRPITYVPYYYRGYHGEHEYMPGFSPQGVLKDLEFWTRTFHRPAHYFEQSGFHPDGTVSHHLSDSSDIAMNAYGYGWLTEVIDAYQLLKDQAVDFGSHGHQFIADRYLYTYDRMIYKNYLDYTVTGRSYFSDGTQPADQIPSMIDRLLAAKQPGTVVTNESELIAWRNAIESNMHEQSGNTPFWIGNYMVHRRGGAAETPYFMSVKMRNDRTSGAEDFDKVRKSWHAGSGILQVMVRGDEYDQTRKNMDWHALPGLTEEWRTDAIVYDKKYLRGGSPYSGMVSDGRYGCAAMEHRSLNGSYSVADADKGYFFTEREAVALGCNIRRANAGQGREIITTIDQTLWVGDVTYALDGKRPVSIPQETAVNLTLKAKQFGWIHQGDVGYVVFPAKGQSLMIRGGADVNVTDPKQAGHADVIHVALGHGKNPSGGALDRYHYVLVPNVSAGEMPAYVSDLMKRVSVVANGDGAQGIYDSSLGMLQMAFYKAGEVCAGGMNVKADRAMMLQLRRDGADWVFCASDPLHDLAAEELNIFLSAPLEAGRYETTLPGIYPVPGEPITVREAEGGVRVHVPLPDPSDDAALSYQAELYAGVPRPVRIPGKPAK